MVVNDEMFQRLVVSTTLEKDRTMAKVIEAANGQQALEVVRQRGKSES